MNEYVISECPVCARSWTYSSELEELVSLGGLHFSGRETRGKKIF